MTAGFYSKKSVWGIPNALLLLMLVFFFVPFAFRGARMALQRTENNVKDWLPSDFRETEELAWFAKQFVSEQFIVATWDGCRADDQRFQMFVRKLRGEQISDEDSGSTDEKYRARMLFRDGYALFVGDDVFQNWGGQDEKWLIDEHGRYFYVTPNGRLFRWNGNVNMVSAAWRAVMRATGSFELEGQFVGAFGAPGTPDEPNVFWQDPRLLTTPLFKTVETGPDLVEQLSGEGGSLANRTEPKAGERDAIARLTGTMFGPPVPRDFTWRSEDAAELIPPETQAQLPEDWQSIWEIVVRTELEENYEGSLEAFRAADPVVQADVWYEFFDAVGVEEPPRQTCVVLTLTEPARRNLGRVVGRGMLGTTQGRVFQLAEECGISAPPKPTTLPPPFSWLAAAPAPANPTLRVGGPPVDNVAIDEEGTITLVRLIGYSLILGFVLSWILLRSMRLMIMVFFVGGVSAMASLGMVWWSNASVDAILLTMPSLVYVLGMAGAIHIVNYYRDAAAEKGIEGAPERAIAHAVMPCTLAALTTAIGLVSLCSSNILPIRKFGIFSAMGVMSTLVLLYIYLPSAMTVFPPKAKTLQEGGQAAAKGILRFWEAVGAFILRRHWYVNAVCLAGFIALGLGLTQIKTSVQLLKLFDADSQIIKDYGWLEENFGRLVPMELVVRFPESRLRPVEVPADADSEQLMRARTQLSLIERADAVTRIQNVLQQQFGYEGLDIVGRGMSPVTLMKDIPSPWGGFHAGRAAYNGKMNEQYDELLATDYLAVEESEVAKGAELWRISLRLGALNDVDYGQFVSSLRAAVEPVVAAYRCRTAVVQSMIDQAEGTQERVAGQVLILGYSDPSHESSKSTKTASGEGGQDSGEPIDAVRIFAETLNRCLVGQTVAKPVWNNPETRPLQGDTATSQRWADFLGQFKAVVILEEHPDYDMDFIYQTHANVIDARPFIADALVPASVRYADEDRPVEASVFPGEMDVVYTGVVPVVYKAQRTLLVSLIESVAWAFVLIALVMTCLLSPARSFRAALLPKNFLQGFGCGALSMIPNVFPVVIIFGFIGWSEKIFGKAILVDIGTMMTASVAMGVAVDDTIHFLTWFREGLKRGLDRRDAIFVAYQHVAPAMTQTTIIAGLGLSVFALSTFTPTQRFGTLMLALLAAALVGDLIFLPALLASPLGRIFAMRPAARDQSQHGKGNTSHPAVGGNVASEEAARPAEQLNAAAADIVPTAKVPEPQLHRGPRNRARRRM